MMTSIQRGRALASCSVLAILTAAGALMGASSAWAQGPSSGADAEGTQVDAVIVTAERSKAAETAPSKASVEETQPESIITRKFIEQATPENGNWVSVAGIAPSVSGVTSNPGGETTKLTLRGFQDGQFNLTYDGIAFGDTNGPTHHEASYWPASTIGSVVIDRGPGAAGDLGQANFGGAIHFFSPTVSDVFGLSQKVTYGSFDSYQAVTTINTGAVPQLGGGKLLLNFQEDTTAGELSDSGSVAQNQLAKFVLPVTSKATLTVFSSINYTRFFQADAGPGETWQQVVKLGKNFALDNNPTDEHYYKDNYEGKHTDFEYADVKYDILPTFTAEDQLYTYYYSNKTIATSSIGDLPGIGNPSSSVGSSANHGGETGQSATDLQGYNKLNLYRVYGDVVRFNKDWSFGTLKIGALAEWSNTDRHNYIEDFTDGFTPDYSITSTNVLNQLTTTPSTKDGTFQKTAERSDWQDYQVFADFYWRPFTGLTITPGIKFVDERLNVYANDDKIATPGGNITEPFRTSNVYSSPLYFLTANYKIRSDWSVYGQVATSFLFPNSGQVTLSGAELENPQPQKTVSYQTGTVYSHGNFTADLDAYRVDATNLLIACTIDDGGVMESAECNAGLARYDGFEGEAAYHFDFGVTLFGNFGSNASKQLASGSVAAGNYLPAAELPNAPRWTDAFGAVYDSGPWQGTVAYKQSGAYATAQQTSLTGGPQTHLPGYDTLDLSGAYDFGHFKVKLAVFNLQDNRAVTSYSGKQGSALFNPADNSDLYEFQVGRQIELTLQAKF